MKRKIHLIVNVCLVLLFAVTTAWSAFDPMNDDTDIFLANPNITAERPNVLIILDNTANWNLPFTNEKNALVQVVNSLSDQFNVGLMMMVETGGGNDNVDGGYMRYHVRQMTTANKTALASMVNNLDILGDKGNNNTASLAMYEAYLYYAGLASNASYGKVKTDKDDTTDPLLSPLAGVHALPASPTASSLYRSPIVDGCQKNFIIYLSNGAINENNAALSFVQGKLAALTGVSPPATIAISPNSQQGNWADELAKFMANSDVNPTLAGVQNVFTYTVEVDRVTTGQGPGTTALFESTATNGKGKYFSVTSDASGTAIVDALNAIFTEIQAVNSVFASTTLPVSVNVRGTNLNQVYIGVFRPDANKAPRWLGNLKMYNLALNSSTGDVFLADATNGVPPAVGDPAQNALTGFVTGAASSFWTENSNFWSFRDATQNGVGGPSDKPDGELVEKGGVAQQIRIAYAASQATRNLYTCTQGGFANCVANSSLSLTPFSDANTDINAANLTLDSRQVSPLTGFQTKAVASLTDRASAVLSNAAGGTVNITSLANGATTFTITSLKTSTPKTVTLLSGAVANSQNAGITSITKANGNAKPITVTTSLGASAWPSNFVVGASVTITGNTVAAYNGVFTITSISAAGSNPKTFVAGNGDGNTGTGTGGTGTITTTVNSTTATATVAGHGYVSGQSITIAGATQTQFNGVWNITVLDTDRFSYGPMSSAQGTAGGTITASGNTTTATAITSAAHGLAVGNPVQIFNANPAGYNLSTTVATVPNGTTFTYTVGSALGDNTATPVYMTRGGSTTVTATTAAAHTFVNGQSITVAGSGVSGYNGTFIISGVTANTFEYSTAPSILPASTGTVTASSGVSAIVTATVANHGFSALQQVVIESVGNADANHPGTWTILTVPDANTFTYSTVVALAAPIGAFTARPVTGSGKAIATLTAHGYANNDQVTIGGASPIAYNGTHTITVVDANTFTYPLATAPGANSSPAVTASKTTTTATGTSTAHGFADGSSVQIAGATPAAFNGTFTIAVVDANTFTYTLPSAQGDATGTINAIQAGGSGTERTNLINWVRGQDNFSDENVNAVSTDIRASVHGDVLHSRPAVINYNRYGSDNDVYVFYGANDGIFRAVKGGYATDALAAVQIAPGREAWGFIPQEFLGSLNRLRKNSPILGSAFKKPYFADGSIGIYTKDADNNDKLGDVGDKVNLYMSMRRGGRLIYALDVNDPHDPKFLWKIDNTTAGFAELGQTWSQPTVIEGLAGYPNPVLVFGAGYDPVVEDLDPANITASTTTTVTTGTGASAVVHTRSMGRGIYVVDAITGALLWRSLRAADGCGTCTTTIVSGMDYAIPSDVTIIKNESGALGGFTNRGYVGDTGGNMWRIDFRWDGTSFANTIVTQIASVGGSGAVKRKFMYPPDVIAGGPSGFGFDAVLIGTGDREHPFDTTVTNRFYMFRDTGNDAGPLTGTTGAAGANPYIVEGTMFDATTNCLQDATATCAGGVTPTVAQTELDAASGWYVTLASGEKVVGNALALGGTVFFNTNQPSASAGGGVCGSNLGIARQYQVSATDAKIPVKSDGTYATSRDTIIAGGGYLPPPVHVVVELGGKTVEAVISGITVTEPPGVTLQARLRKFWYKEID